MDSEYFQVLVEEDARERLAFFTPYGKWLLEVIPMGALNASPTFLAMMINLKM